MVRVSAGSPSPPAPASLGLIADPASLGLITDPARPMEGQWPDPALTALVAK